VKVRIEEQLADDLFQLLGELVDRAKENRDDIVMKYVAELQIQLGHELVRAKGGKNRKYTLPNVKNLRQLN